MLIFHTRLYDLPFDHMLALTHRRMSDTKSAVDCTKWYCSARWEILTLHQVCFNIISCRSKLTIICHALSSIQQTVSCHAKIEYFLLYAILSNAQQSCVPATALGVWFFVIRMRSENIELWCSGDRRYWFFVLGHGDRKYWFLVLRDQKILILGAPEAPTKGGDPSTCQNPPES